MPASQNLCCFPFPNNEPSFSTSPLRIATFIMFPSFASFTRFALPPALAAAAVKDLSSWLGETPSLCCAMKDGNAGNQAQGMQQRAEQRDELLEERDSEVASLLAEEPCCGAQPESRWGVGRTQAEIMVSYLHALLSCSVFHASSSAVKQ